MKSTDLCKLNIQPYPYQIKGIEEGIRMKRFINGDECGLGKTLMALATIAISGNNQPICHSIILKKPHRKRSLLARYIA